MGKINAGNGAADIVLLDGAIGTTLQKFIPKTKGFPEIINLTDPELVIEIQRSYVEAGSKILYTNTCSANAKKAEQEGYRVDEVVRAAVKNARIAGGDSTKVALDIASVGEMMEPYGTLSEGRAYEIFSEIVAAGKDTDLVVFETMFDLNELLCAIRAVKENSDLPIFATMTFTASGKTITGCTPGEMARALEAEGVEAIGINCSLGPEESYPIMKELSVSSGLPLIIKPNAGKPDPKTGTYAVGPDEFARKMLPFVQLGVSYMGGCCGTDPDYIRALKKALDAEAR